MITPQVKPTPYKRATLAVDFDGVIHSYDPGWQDGKIYGEPIAGCEDALRRLVTNFELIVFTARHDLEAVHLWLVLHGLRAYFSEITNRKPAAVAYLDDRGLKFTSWAQAEKDLLGS